MRVRTCSQPVQAEMLKASLEAQGFRALILNKRDSSYGMFGEVEVHVPVIEVEQVLALLDSLNEQDPT